MTDEEIKALQEENAALKKTAADTEKTIKDLTAERDSLKTENEALTKAKTEWETEEKKLKETNYTLARHINVASDKSVEELLNEAFK